MTKEEIFNILYGPEKWDIYHQFQDIENSIDEDNTMYKYFDDLKKMLIDNKSYIKLRGFRLICRLSKYDTDKKIDKCINELLNVLDDDKPSIVRQCLASINYLLLFKPYLSNVVEQKLRKLDYTKYKDSMSPLIKKDIDNILENI